jgi:YfiH family protein
VPIEPHTAAAGGLLSPPRLQSEALAAARIGHGFFGRAGGVSTGIYASLNAGPGSADSQPAVAENRRRIAAAMGVEPTHLMSPHQEHSAKAVRVDARFAGARPQADGLVTTARGLALSVLTADCAPVLLADAEAGVIGAAHAGWRGALSGILEAVAALMRSAGARRIVAAIGPCISQQSYEIGPEFEERFLREDAKSAAFFSGAQRRCFDLPGYCVARLARLDVERIDALLYDTYSAPEAWFSHRRAVHAGEGDYGRNCAAIVL